MSLFKADFFRFFAIGFIGGTALVFTALDSGGELAREMVPVAEAAAAR